MKSIKAFPGSEFSGRVFPVSRFSNSSPSRVTPRRDLFSVLNTLKKTSKSTAGFTLIELLLVISIITLLSSIIFANVNSARLRARDAKRIAEISQLNRALTLYFNTNNYTYPPLPGACGSATWAESNVVPCWTAIATILNPYLSVFPVDPINRTVGVNSYVYVYQPVNGNSGYRLGANLENMTATAKGDGCWAIGGAPTNFPDTFYCLGDNWQL